MSINVNYVYTEVQNLANKYQASGYLSPDEFNGYAQMASRELLEELTTTFQANQEITTALQDYIVIKPLSADAFGYLPYPSDYAHFVALSCWQQPPQPDCEPDYKTLGRVPVKMLDNDKLAYRLSSTLNPPTLENPIACQYARGIRIYPISNAVIEYIKTPATPVWGYTLDANGIAVYNAATSTDFDWNSSITNKLIFKIARMFGIEVRDEVLGQASVAGDKIN